VTGREGPWTFEREAAAWCAPQLLRLGVITLPLPPLAFAPSGSSNREAVICQDG
jgi:hypothetical protein